ncbi:MAG TPA: hypothetical protein VLM11_13730 [Streptosporangiaceae bacterium]|nr:hypothetical protein [Streptosporangiaceae bacterium]
MSQAGRVGRRTRIVGDYLSGAAIVIALVNNDTLKWAIGLPIVLAIVGVGLRVEAAITTSRSALEQDAVDS